MKSDSGAGKSVCPKCGKTFTCSPQGNCWCNGYALSNKSLLLIRKKYKGCLCENCLRTYAASPADSQEF